MRTIVYYENAGEVALKRVAYLRAMNGPGSAQAIVASGYCGERIKADVIEFTDDVPAWIKSKIEDGFAFQKAKDAEAEAERERKRTRIHDRRAPPIMTEDEFRRSMSSRAPVPDEGAAEPAKRGPGRPRKDAA